MVRTAGDYGDGYFYGARVGAYAPHCRRTNRFPRLQFAAVKVAEAKALVVDLMMDDLAASDASVLFDPASPDPRDPGKFVLGGKVARAIHHYDGWYVPIELSWFSGGFGQPQVHGQPFYWYVFAIPKRSRYARDHYMVCDYLQMRDWVLDFAAPLDRDHRDHKLWRADLRIYTDGEVEREGYFRWGDEDVGDTSRPERVFELDNVSTVHELELIGKRVGSLGAGGESAAHRRLKLYVATHPLEFGLSDGALPFVEHRFRTGDRVDVMFENHAPDRTVVEIEVQGEENICIGIHQAIKYRSLAEAEAGYALLGGQVNSLVVAYETAYPRAVELADQYAVTLCPVDRELVLASAV